jgi:hypothetical protein
MPFGGIFPPTDTSIPYWDALVDTGDGGVPAGSFGYGEGETFMINPWDVVVLNGKPLPGVCKVKAIGKLTIDRKKPAGRDGLTITSQGYDPGNVDIEILLWTWKQWKEMVTAAVTLWARPRRGGQVKALDIFHPGLALWAIRSVVIECVSIPEPGPVPQSMVVRLKAVEHLPPDQKNKTKTMKASGNVAVDKNIARKQKNAGGDPPSVKSVGPRGEEKDTTPGST